MAITDQQVAAMRAYLSASSDTAAAEAERRFIMLARAGGAGGLGKLLYAAFVVAARRTFAPSWRSADLVRFVADVRSGAGESYGLLDPTVAEKQLRAVVGGESADSPDEEKVARAQLILLAALTERLCLTPRDLDILLSDGRSLADQLIAAGGR